MSRICLLLIPCLCSLAACNSIPRLEKEGIIAYGYQNGAPMYDSISIKIEKVPGKVVPLFCVQLSPSADPLRSDQLTELTVSKYLPEFEIPKYWPQTWKLKALENQDFAGNGFYISFNNGNIQFLGMGTREQDPDEPITKPVSPAKIGPADCLSIYTLPLTREQFVEIFGQPDRDDSVSEVYY